MSKPRKPNRPKGLSNIDLYSYGVFRQEFVRWSDGVNFRTDAPDGYYKGQLYRTKAPLVVGDFHAPKPWAYEVRDRVYVNGTFLQNYGSYYVRGSGQIYHPTYVNSDIPTPNFDRPDLYNKALERLNERVRGNLDLGVSLAEAGQTARMLRATGKLETYLQGLGAFRSLKSLSGAAGNAWLAYTYGLKPLVNDVYAAADEAIRIALNKIEDYSGSASESIPALTQALPVTSGQHLKYSVNYNGKHGYRIHVRMSVPDWDIARWTSLNPASLAWELLPYSFVVDWFYDIGGMMRSLETALLYQQRFVSGYYSVLLAFDAVGKGEASDVNGWAKATSSYRFRKFARVVLSTYPFPRMPSLKADLGSSRLLSAAALLRQRLK